STGVVRVGDRCKSYTEARPEVHTGVDKTDVRKPFVTRIEHATGRIDVNARLIAGAKPRQVSIHVSVRRERIPAQPHVERQSRIDAQIVLSEQSQVMEARVLVFADALCEGGELSEEEIGQRVSGETRAIGPSELAVGAEVVHDVALTATVITTERNVMAFEGQARRIGDLIFVAQEGVGVAGIEREVSIDGQVVLRGIVVVVPRAERDQAGRIDLKVVVVRAVEGEDGV